MKIPRIFHFVWLGDKPIPTAHQQYMQTWKTLHPDWQIKLWRENDLPKLSNQAIFDDLTVWSGKSNVARYEILYKYGGVYVDTDFEALKNLEPLIIKDELFVAYERNRSKIVNNAIIGAIPKHPVLKTIIDSLPSYYRAHRHELSPWQTGPHYITPFLKRASNVTIYPATLFYPYSWREPYKKQKRFLEAYAVHHWTLSWAEKQSINYSLKEHIKKLLFTLLDLKRSKRTEHN